MGKHLYMQTLFELIKENGARLLSYYKMFDIFKFTFALVPGRFLLKIVEPSAIFMVAKLTFSGPDIWREILAGNSSLTIKDFAQRVHSLTNISFPALTILGSQGTCISIVEERNFLLCLNIEVILSYSKWHRDERFTSQGGAREIIDLEAHQRFSRANFELLSNRASAAEDHEFKRKDILT